MFKKNNVITKKNFPNRFSFSVLFAPKKLDKKQIAMYIIQHPPLV